MDSWKYFDITHREHVICNPTSEEKLSRLVGLLRLPPAAQVVDIACGKGEFLLRLAEAYNIRGTGIDLSPFFVAEAAARLEARAPGADVRFIEMDGVEFQPDGPHSLDLASCVGASWIFGGHADTLRALAGMVRPGGWVVVGEPFWRQEPSAEYLEALQCAREDFGSHYSNAQAGEALGLELAHTLVSSKDDWDRYEGLQWFSTAEYARAHPADHDVTELLERVRGEREAYLRWGRDTLGWAIYLFRAPSAP
jgi:SAM-dependent methyltransferase